MTGTEALQRTATALRGAGIDDPEAEAGILLRHAQHRDRAYMYAHLPEELSADQELELLHALERRMQHWPTAYLTGVREFYGIEFYVAPGVLIPRPETELLVEESLRQLRVRAGGRIPVYADVGTGSGAVVVSVAKEWPNATYFAVDISEAALQIAALNAKRPRLAGRIQFLHGDLLQPIPLQPDVVAANLPYIPTELVERLPSEIRDHEPRIALDGGTSGIQMILRLIDSAKSRLANDGALLMEVGAGQANAVLTAAASAFPDWHCYSVRDLAGIERMVVADGGPNSGVSQPKGKNAV
jgi:release factor glutamine methyltransferase